MKEFDLIVFVCNKVEKKIIIISMDLMDESINCPEWLSKRFCTFSDGEVIFFSSLHF